MSKSSYSRQSITGIQSEQSIGISISLLAMSLYRGWSINDMRRSVPGDLDPKVSDRYVRISTVLHRY